MKLRDLEILVVGNPPPGFGGRYFILVKLTTACGITGWGEVYAATVGPEAMRAVIADVFARHMEGENPENIEWMFRKAYSAGFTQRPDPTVMGAFSGLEIACWDILGKSRDRPVHALWGGRVWDRLRSYSYLYPEPHQDPSRFYNDPEASAEAARAMVEAGFTAIKFDPAGAYTVRGGHQPTMPDLDRSEAFCRAIRRAVGDRADLLRNAEAHLAELLHGDVARLGAGHVAALDQAEGDILPDGQGVEQCCPLEQHAETLKILVTRRALEADHLFACHLDRAGFGLEDAEHAFQHHRLAGAGAADHHQRMALGHRQVDTVQHMLGSEALLDAVENDMSNRHRAHSENSSEVRTKFAARMRMAEETTALVVARPTPAAPPLELKP